MLRFSIKVLGYLFLLLGIVGLLTPIPFGIVFTILAILLLVPTSPGSARVIRYLRRKSRRLDRVMTLIIRRAPAPYRRILRQTDIDFASRSVF